MDIKIELNKQQLDKLNSSFKRFEKEIVSNAKEPLQQSAQIVKDESDKNFATQGFTYGEAWKPLAPSTRKQRARLGFNPARPILERTGGLRRSTRIVKVTNREAVVQNTNKVAKYHDKGGTKMPKRTILTTTQRTNDAIKIVWTNHIAKLLKKFF